jgi:hypothetical protein
MTPTTRYLCPLNCGWHHDEDPADVPPQVTVDADTLASGDLGAVISAVAFAHAKAALEHVESTVKAHLETHPLIEWAQKVASLQRDLAGAEADVQLAMDEWGKSDKHHAEKSVAAAAERGAWGTTRMRVWNAAFIADAEDVTDWQRGYRACSERVVAALDEPVDMVIYDFNTRPLPTPATPSRTTPDNPVTSSDAADKGGEQP